MDYKILKGENMTCKDVIQAIAERKLTGLMVHDELTDMFDLLNMHGFKRMHEYRATKETAEFRSFKRWVINRHGYVPMTRGSEVKIDFYGIRETCTRDDITRENKKKVVTRILHDLVLWEQETLTLLSEAKIKMFKLGYVSDSCMLDELVMSTDKELKYYKRNLIYWTDMNFNLDYMLTAQEEIHEEYRVKQKDEMNMNFN